jgi:large subunit ribosomal protein L17
MRKKVFGRKLSRDRGSRTALFRSLVRAMVERGKIVTTKAKAKAVQPMLEKLVSVSKTKDVAVIRRTFAYLGNDKKTIGMLFGQISESFKDRKGGFTRLINLPRRRGDSAEMSRIEWTEKIEVRDKKSEVSKKSKEKKQSNDTLNVKVDKKEGLKSKVSRLLKSRKK